MPQITTPIFNASEYSLANFVITRCAKAGWPILTVNELNYKMALLEGFSQNYYQRPLVHYNSYFKRIDKYIYLPIITKEFKSICGNFDNADNFHVIKYPKLSTKILNSENAEQVMTDVNDMMTNLINAGTNFDMMTKLINVATRFIQTTVRQNQKSTSHVVLPTELAELYLNYEYANKTRNYSAPKQPNF